MEAIKIEAYLDNAATTKPLKEVIDIMVQIQRNNYGNPSSLHKLGIDADNLLNNARNIIAKSINAKPEQILFTSSATESNNLAIMGALKRLNKKGNIITSVIEHSSVKNLFNNLEYEKRYISVDKEGFINLEQLESLIDENTLLVSIIHGNNEIGTIQDIKKISTIIKNKNKNTLFHVDASQSFTKTDIDVKELDIDLLTLNSHKIHGPKGASALFFKSKRLLKPILFGGHQEFNLRPGTENIPAIIGFAKAVEIAMNEKDKNILHMRKLQKFFIEELLKIPRSELNGPSDLDKRLCNNINISFDFIEGEALLMLLNHENVYVSTGSACSSKTLEISHVLAALNKPIQLVQGTLRVSTSKFTTMEEAKYAVEKIRSAVKALRKISHLTPEELR